MLYFLRINNANLPAVVVLPAPCKPTIMTTVGGLFAILMEVFSPPIKLVSSSCTILITCCPGVKDCMTSEPSARSETVLTNSLTTLKLTSASNNANLTSRIIVLISASVTFPLPRIFCIVACKRSDNPSNAITFALLYYNDHYSNSSN